MSKPIFLGENRHTVDAKGRVAIPARFRAKLERGAVLTRGVDDCLYVFPVETWEEKAEEMAAAITDARLRRIAERRFFAYSTELEMDAQGRALLPLKFRQYAGLNGEAMIVGARDRFEIWSPERWEAFEEEMAAEDLSGLPLPF
jgi:MraZ protein